jgi:hypothetical protein
MADQWSLAQVNSFVLRKQHLIGPSRTVSIVQSIQDIGGLHATGAAAPYLSLWARGRASGKEDLYTALYEEHSLAKVLCMRNTLFILPKELLPMAYQATRQRRRALLDRYLRHYGITDQEYHRGCAEVAELLAAGPRTTAEIKQELSDPAMSVMVDLMPDDWWLVRGAPRGTWRSSQHEYVPFHDWFPGVELDSMTPREAQTRLVWHYLSSFGPASLEDIAWWSGLSSTEVQRALEALGDQVVETEVAGLQGTYWATSAALGTMGRDNEPEYPLTFLPSLDPCLMGYKDRSRFLHPSNYDRVFDRSGNALPTVWGDGRVIGVWMEDKKTPAVQVFLFEPLGGHLRQQMEKVALRLTRFLEHGKPNIEIKPYPQDMYARTPFSLGQRA